ncbi:hypothetical protein [Sulfuricurvum sp.]|uniref:hypothetical protein n=1 Tax=Sulfuricurvum sp. TaxID=2025608 RepID=UPI00261125E3|nr:hypothetical protein [Sulfuricurvum sp.]MDD3597097.1 hypothetical protein [Sulfuricurvum sp.]
MKSFFALLVLTIYLSASSDVCKTEWVLSNGVKTKPSSSFKTFTLIDSRDLNSVTMKTQSGSTQYVYDGFIDPHDGRLGISYKSPTGILMDRFEDGTLYFWEGNTQIVRAKCPRIEIGKVQR